MPVLQLGIRTFLCVLLCLHSLARTAGAGQGNGCEALNEAAIRAASIGDWRKAETLVEQARIRAADDSSECVAVIFSNLATIAQQSGNMGAAESFAHRSIAMLGRPGRQAVDPRSFVPLQVLAAVYMERSEVGKARHVFQQLEAMPTNQPMQQAQRCGLAALLLQLDGNMRAAEAKYLEELAFWEQVKEGDGGQSAGALLNLSSLYLQEGRYAEAQRPLAEAEDLLRSRHEGATYRTVSLLNNQAAAFLAEHNYAAAEDRLRRAAEVASQLPNPPPGNLATLLSNRAFVLKKLGQNKQAKAEASKADLLRKTFARTPGGNVIDLSQLAQRGSK